MGGFFVSLFVSVSVCLFVKSVVVVVVVVVDCTGSFYDKGRMIYMLFMTRVYGVFVRRWRKIHRLGVCVYATLDL